MELKRVNGEEFAAAFAGGGGHLYNSVPFIEHNRSKCEEVMYFLFIDGKPRLGLVFGRRGEVLYSPFSAPFGGFATKGEQRIQYYLEAAKVLKEMLSAEGLTAEIALPPPFYGEALWTKSVSAFSYAGELMYTDLNYHYPLEQCADCESHMWRNAAKNYRASLKVGFEVEVLDASKEADIARAYAVIKANRSSHGYPLRMTLDEVIATAPIARARFLVMSHEGRDVAAAQIHTVAEGIGQVVYWGDAPGYSELRPMNFFTMEVMRHCRRAGMHVLDIGPSSEDGIPSAGLCDFKESIGCVPSPKFRFRISGQN